MTSGIREYLDTALVRIQQESFGRRNAPEVSLSSDTVEDSDGALTGALEMRIRTRSGAMPLIQCKKFDKLKSRREVDDLLANALSVLLMNYANWPR